jgi:ABC-type multidrug transport system fused ATPase/permease subunit
MAGFTLTFSLNISNDLLFLVRRVTQLELAMVGVERLIELGAVKQEAAEIVEPRPPAHWPQGAIEVRNLEIRYAPELPAVLHDLSFSIKAGEKVGIVGATGCGKSTLAASFFRFVEATSGAILIDGLNIADIGLYDLRSKLTIVPQDPVRPLFPFSPFPSVDDLVLNDQVILSGTLRSTLDMFGAYDDHEIFDALRRVHLIKEGEERDAQDSTANRSVFFNLDAEVAEGVCRSFSLLLFA